MTLHEEVAATITRHNELYRAVKTVRRHADLQRELEGEMLSDLRILRRAAAGGTYHEDLLRRVQAGLNSVESRFREANNRPVRRRKRAPQEADERVGPQSVHSEAWLRWLIGGGVGIFLLVVILLLQPSLLLTLFGVGTMMIALAALVWFPIFYLKNGLPKSPSAYVAVALAVCGWVFLCIQFNNIFLVVLPLIAALITLVLDLTLPKRWVSEEEHAH